MPTTGHDDEQAEETYDYINELIKHVRGDENLIILGDWNAVVGELPKDKITGKYGLGKRNKRGNRLIELCAKHKPVAANTLFQYHVRRRYTWTMSASRGRYQIDYILTKQNLKIKLKIVKATQEQILSATTIWL
ncbi:hypothetical protein ILUMI_01577 [Ignelater luminosus]|uniref:Endonuclease/exonuclease/phosphatase domain-containing protein n=1 Tax=Ignelater luminosus TaxID=2038154 RepID=A0A8K0DJR2_IGNLU|nr:hypothetical protein ILUMI_01577 [Ignelater luminosus]